jgi:hypothetical protein
LRKIANAGPRFLATSRRAERIRTDTSRFRTLPPGEYYAVALDSIEPGEWADRDFLERVRARATAFSLSGEPVDLKLQTGDEPRSSTDESRNVV